jgi:hypothetical protein
VTEQNPPDPAGTAPTRPCEHCGVPFVPTTVRNRFCGPTCRYTARDRARGHLPVNTEMTTICSDCGRPFTYVKFRKPRIRCTPCADALAHRERPEW